MWKRQTKNEPDPFVLSSYKSVWYSQVYFLSLRRPFIYMYSLRNFREWEGVLRKGFIGKLNKKLKVSRERLDYDFGNHDCLMILVRLLSVSGKRGSESTNLPIYKGSEYRILHWFICKIWPSKFKISYFRTASKSKHLPFLVYTFLLQMFKDFVPNSRPTSTIMFGKTWLTKNRQILLNLNRGQFYSVPISLFKIVDTVLIVTMLWGYTT